MKMRSMMLALAAGFTIFATPLGASAETVAKIGDTEYATVDAAMGAATAAVATAVPADAPKPEVKGIRVADGYVYVTVANTTPYLQYNLAAGTDPANLGEANAAETPVNGKAGEDIILVTPAKSDGGFFRVERN